MPPSLRLPLILAAAFALSAPAHAEADSAALFQGRYADLRSAMQEKDAAKIAAVLAPDYRLTDIQGDEHDAAAMTERMGRMPQSAGRSVETKVLSAAITGDRAAVEQELTGAMSRTDPDGEEHNMELQLRSSDIWALRGGNWLLVSSVQKELTVKRDGEVFLHQQN